MKKNIVLKFFDSLRKNGSLGAIYHVCKYMQRLDRVPGCRRLFSFIDGLLCIFSRIFERYLDISFDRKYGTDTAGVIPLKDLTIKRNNNVEDCLWYQSTQVQQFKQIMNHLTIKCDEFEFIDFGSGKGRVLLLAADYGFKKIIGVEFAQELHRIATENVAIRERHTQKPSNIETICMDAAEFPIPNVPVVIFFFGPFKGEIMEQVLNNVSKSFTMNPRKIQVVFFGCFLDPMTIELHKVKKFHCRELELHPNWARLWQYRCFLLTSPEAK